SLIMARPRSACFRVTSSTARATRASSATWSYDCPASRACKSGIRSSGRGRLPTCVVRMRLLLRFINTLLRHELIHLQGSHSFVVAVDCSLLFHFCSGKTESLDCHFFPAAGLLQSIVAV